jgi:hypothetical protein
MCAIELNKWTIVKIRSTLHIYTKKYTEDKIGLVLKSSVLLEVHVECEYKYLFIYDIFLTIVAAVMSIILTGMVKETQAPSTTCSNLPCYF